MNTEQYDELKDFNGKTYTGMKIGGSHNWTYPNGQWHETKIGPDAWKFDFQAIKRRNHAAAENTGAAKGTIYHWYIIADQKATKIDANAYQTFMEGMKFKIGHKRPHWRTFSYNYDDQVSYRERVIQALEQTLERLKQEQAAAEAEYEP